MSAIAVGLMSGTSADGISAAAAEFTEKKFRLLGFKNFSYPSSVAARIRQGPLLTARELSSLNMELGEFFAAAANTLLSQLRIRHNRVTCIGTHGQTIYHGPLDSHPNTLQIADPAVIAERTKIAVVSQFRQRDIAAGGEGAPLMPFFEQYFFGDGPVRAFQNIGGIANISVVGRGIEPLAFDNGPGNGLMDEAMRMISRGKKTMDENGALAAQGSVDIEKLDSMLSDNYFRRPPPKSTGLEKFGRSFLIKHWGRHLNRRPENTLATLNFLTGLAIQESLRSFILPKYALREVVVSGGGSKNSTLMRNLSHLLHPLPVVKIEKWGIPTQAKEPLAFAFFALRAVQHKINHIPQTTGAAGPRVLGSITFA